MSDIVEPGFAVEGDSVDDQRVVAFPMTDGLSEPGRIGIFRMLGVHQDDAIHVRGAFVKDHHAIGELNYLEWIWGSSVARHATWQTIALRVIFRVVGAPFLEQ